jgi:hypothetical protein
VGIFAADPHPQREPARGELRDRSELPGERNWVPQRQQEEPDVHRQLILSGKHRCRSDQSVRASPHEEADVISDAEVVDALRSDAREHRMKPLLTAAERLIVRREEPHADASHRRSPGRR